MLVTITFKCILPLSTVSPLCPFSQWFNHGLLIHTCLSSLAALDMFKLAADSQQTIPVVSPFPSVSSLGLASAVPAGTTAPASSYNFQPSHATRMLQCHPIRSRH